MAKERILVTVKTYPTLSRKYGETVCTAGIRESGGWIRLYPVPFRGLDEKQQYRKYDWIECSVDRNTSDPRPESYRPRDFERIAPVAHMDTDDQWRERRRFIFDSVKVETRLSSLIDDAKSNARSLALFKPTRITDFKWDEDEREWDLERLRHYRESCRQLDLFAVDLWKKTFSVVNKLPYGFMYTFEDADSKSSTLHILDWEIGALYWNCLRDAKGDESKALIKVKQKYFDEFTKTDVHFYMGTTQQWHSIAPNPWLIIGVLPIPHQQQPELF